MRIELIRKNEIVEFARKGIHEFRSFIPITIPRAVSQSRNPDADENDVLLIIAREENKLLSLIGRYPSRIQNDPSRKIFWVSCWWKAPGVSSVMSKAVLEKFLEISGKNIGLPHLPEHIIKTLKKYNIVVKGRPGMMIRLRSALHQRSLERSITGKKSRLINFFRKFRILASYDLILNTFIRQKIVSGTCHYDPGYEVLSGLPGDEYFSFIEENFQNYLSIPYKENVEWILKNPWLVNKDEADKDIASRYHFSYVSDNYHHFFPVLKEEGKMRGAAFFSSRDGVVKSLFIFVLPGSKEKFLMNISRYIEDSQSYHSLITFDPQYYSFLQKNVRSMARIVEVMRYTGVGDPDLCELEFTDGDGDSCFT